MEKDKGKIAVYKNKIEVSLKDDTVWLTQAQIVDLFDSSKANISEHIKAIYKDGELLRNATVRKFRTVQKEGKRSVTRDLQHYNLDMIISVGYRVNAKRGVQFRIWATKILKQHLIDGYTINEKRLKKEEQKYLELKKAVSLMANVVKIDNISKEAKGLAQVISEYTKALDILDDFDHQRLKTPKGHKRSKYKLTYEKAKDVIQAMKEKFNDSEFVGQEKDDSFKGSINAIYQTAFKKEVYPTIEEKAAHLLYFTTKNHSFIDGNKRIAAALFVCFLERNGILHKKDGSKTIDDNALIALTIMIASSDALDKDIMVKVIMNLLK